MPVQEIVSMSQLQQVLNSKQLVVIDFHAQWCGPCKVIAPAFEQLSADYPQVCFVKIDVDRCKDIAQHYGVSAMPTFKIISRSEVVETVQGADDGVLRRYVDLYSHSIQAPGTTTSATTSSTSGAGTQFEPVLHLFAKLSHSIPESEKTLSICEDILGEIYKLAASTGQPLGLNLLPVIFAHALPEAAFDTFLQTCLAQPEESSLEHHDAKTIVDHLLSYLTSCLSWMDKDSNLDGRRELFFIADFLTKAPTALKLMLNSPHFNGEGVTTGRQLQTGTFLGAALGLGMWNSRFSHQDELGEMMKLFPWNTQNADAAKTTSNESKAQVERHISSEHDYMFPIVRKLLSGAEQRTATLKWMAKFVEFNLDWKKDMPKYDVLANRFCLHNVSNILVSLALPVLEGKDFPQGVSSSYVIDESEHPLLFKSMKEIEPIGINEESRATKKSGDVNYSPKVELFFLAAHAQHLSTGSILGHMHSWENTLHHPDATPQQKAVYNGLVRFHKALLTQKEVALRTVRFANGMSKWLLGVAGIDASSGILPKTAPPIWNSLPLFFFEDTIRVSNMIGQYRLFEFVDYYSILDTVSLTLVMMGNERYVSKPHCHAVFPKFLLFLTQFQGYRRNLETHPYYSRHILQSCVNCYIAVAKAELERLSSRYYLSTILADLLGDRMLCDPVRDNFENDEDPLLEMFSNMVTSEASSALENVIENLESMHEKEEQKSVAELLQDEEYQGKGQGLKQHIQIYKATIDVFSALGKQFPKGVLRHYVASQIAMMLVKSLTRLAGKRSKELKIKNPKMYEFDPREMLQSVVDCFLLFSKEEVFLKAIIGTGLPMEDFDWCIKNICHRDLVSYSAVANLRIMNQKITEIHASIDDDDDGFEDEAPEWAQCPIMGTLLVDPRAMPGMGTPGDRHWVEFENIRHQLLSDKQNPFNRQPLTLEEFQEFNASEELVTERAQLLDRIQAAREEFRRGNSGAVGEQ